jgi:hypothetical protein
MLMATCITLYSTENAALFKSLELLLLELVVDTTVPFVSTVSLRVIWSALVIPLSKEPDTASPEGTWTKIAGSIAAAARP